MSVDPAQATAPAPARAPATGATAAPAAPARARGAVATALRRAFGSDGRRRDVTTAITLFALGLLLLQVGLVTVWPSTGDADGLLGPAQPWWRVALLAAGCALVLVERARPMLALAGGAVVTLVDASWGGSLAVLLVLWELLYNAALRAGPRARSWLWTLAVAITVVGAVVAGESARDVRYFVYAGIQLGAILLVPMWWADNVRVKTELADLERARADEAARAAQAERERAADLERLALAERHEAVQAERAAMARDLHDVIASHLSTIAIHSGAALSAPAEAGRDRAALEQVRASAVASLTEMRSMIELLRAESPAEPLAAPGRLDRLGALVDAARDAGGVVTVEDPDEIAGAPLPAAVGQALHRIAQEALTNARKHAPGAAVTVRLARHGDQVSLEVRNAATPSTPPLDEPVLSAGTGLFSMRERADALGGALTAGPGHDGAWTVRAVVPARVAS